MGFLGSIAYQKRDTDISSYQRAPGSTDYDYRNTSFAGTEWPARGGFAMPTGTTITQSQNPTTGAITNSSTILTNPLALAAEPAPIPRPMPPSIRLAMRPLVVMTILRSSSLPCRRSMCKNCERPAWA